MVMNLDFSIQELRAMYLQGAPASDILDLLPRQTRQIVAQSRKRYGFSRNEKNTVDRRDISVLLGVQNSDVGDWLAKHRITPLKKVGWCGRYLYSRDEVCSAIASEQ